MKNIKTLIVAGGGTAGLVSALIIKNRFPSIKIKILKSEKIGIIGVGEGSTEHWFEFMKFCNIDFKELIKKTDATIKLGVMFKDWAKKDYYHNIISLSTKNTFGQYLAFYGHHIFFEKNQLDTTDQSYTKNVIFKAFLNNNIEPSKQFHFNTHKLNNYLQEICLKNNIEIIDCEIKEVILNSEGEIKNLLTDLGYYDSDFYLDCTGFKKLLISKLGAKWQSYKEHLKMKETIAFPTEDTENYNVYTVAQAMKYGWMFQIPTYGRQGNGYIFDSDYINADQAKDEVEKILNRKIEIARHIKFEPGCVDKPWINNCVAIGLSANFVEPLEATSIGTSIQQVFLLTHYLSNYTENNIKDYNFKVNKIMENIRDFIFLHYMVKKNDSIFWKDLKKIKIPNTLENLLNKWNYRLPILEDFTDTNFLLFNHVNFTSVLMGIDLLNKDNIKKEYLNQNEQHRNFINDLVLNFCKINDNEYMLHKEYLQLIRNENSINK